MNLNSLNFSNIDEEEIKKDEEKQQNEIAALLAQEFNNIEVNDETSICSTDANDDTNDSKIQLNDCSAESNEKENFLVFATPRENQFIPNWNYTNYTRNIYDGQMISQKPLQMTDFNCLQTNNNNYAGVSDISNTWDLSLHGETGLPLNYDTFNEIQSPEEKPIKYKVITREVAVECIPINQRELDNLELLYEARGKRLEQLTTDLDSEREKRIKETRASSHKTTLLEAELRNNQVQLSKALEELEQQRQEINELSSQTITQSTENQQQAQQINELQKVIEARNSIIESLNEQLASINSSSTLRKNNEQQEELMDCMNRQYNTESARLKAEIGKLNERLEEKIQETTHLQLQLDDQTKQHNKNRLQLRQEYNNICEQLTEQKEQNQQYDKYKHQIQQLEQQIVNYQTEQLINQDINKYLQYEVNDLTDQLSSYEQQDTHDTFQKSSRRSINRCKSSEMVTDVNSAMNSSDLYARISELKSDNLDLVIKSRRLQQEFEECEKLKCDFQNQLESTNRRLQQLQTGEKTDKEKRLQESNDSLQAIKDSLDEQCSLLKDQLQQLRDQHTSMQYELQQTRENMSQQRYQLEREKQEAVAEVKQVCTGHYEQLRTHLELSWTEQKEMIIREESEKRAIVEKDLSDALSEIDRIKSLYIQLCQERSSAEDDKQNWNDWLAQKLDEQKRSLNRQFLNDKLELELECKRKLREQKELYDNGYNSSRKTYHNMYTETEDDYDDEGETNGSRNYCEHGMCCGDKCFQEIGVQIEIEPDKEVEVINAKTQTGKYNEPEEKMLLDELKKEKDEYCDRLEVKIEECHDMKQRIEELESQVYNLQQQNRNIKETFESSQPARQCEQGSQAHTATKTSTANLPSAIRASTPNFIQQHHKPHRQHLSNSQTMPNLQKTRFSTDYLPRQKNDSSTKKVQEEFFKLKSELVQHLTEISSSMDKLKTEKHLFSSENSHNTTKVQVSIQSSYTSEINQSSEQLIPIRLIYEKLQTWLLQVQIRAADTIRFELAQYRDYYHGYLRGKLTDLVPLSLSVEAELIGIDAAKMKLLLNKLVLVINHIFYQFDPASKSSQHSNDTSYSTHKDSTHSTSSLPGGNEISHNNVKPNEGWKSETFENFISHTSTPKQFTSRPHNKCYKNSNGYVGRVMHQSFDHQNPSNSTSDDDISLAKSDIVITNQNSSSHTHPLSNISPTDDDRITSVCNRMTSEINQLSQQLNQFYSTDTFKPPIIPFSNPSITTPSSSCYYSLDEQYSHASTINPIQSQNSSDKTDVVLNVLPDSLLSFVDQESFSE